MSVDDRKSGAPIGLHVEDQIATVTLYRPQVLNAVDRSMALALAETFDILESDGDVRAVVVTGAGEKAFCVGADLKEAAQPGRRVRVKGGFASLTERSFPKPLIAAVNGLALGGGAEICLACDLIVAEEHARFGFPEVRRGLFAGAGGLERLPRRIPAAIAMELFLTGREIGAERACELGLVNEVVPSGESVVAARNLAREICEGAPMAVQYSMTVVRALTEIGHHDVRDATRDLRRRVLNSADLGEGLRAYAEKRSPHWTGS